MPKTRSARGEMVDFDLLKIKSQIASAPPTTDVTTRQNLIDQKLKRKVKRITQQQVAALAEVAVEPVLPSADVLDQDPYNIEDIE